MRIDADTAKTVRVATTRAVAQDLLTREKNAVRATQSLKLQAQAA